MSRNFFIQQWGKEERGTPFLPAIELIHSPKMLKGHKPSISRRQFLNQTAAVAVGITCGSGLSDAAPRNRPDESFLQTVLGPVSSAEFGPALVHEHVMCDFIGAEQTGRHRWDVDLVVKRMMPYLKQLTARGVTGFVDCTPAFIGRDPRVLKRLAEETGLRILTNTGYYGAARNKFLPRHTFTDSLIELSGRWIAEWQDGIDETGIRPGFIKIGVDSGRLSDIHRKLIRTAARTHLHTGLTIAAHTGDGVAAWACTSAWSRSLWTRPTSGWSAAGRAWR